MKWISKVFILGLVILAFGGGFYLGHGKGITQGKATQHSKDSKQLGDLSSANTILTTTNTDLSSRYNQLSDDYNSLRTTTVQYINVANYRPVTHINCTSNSIGSYTYTNCY